MIQKQHEGQRRAPQSDDLAFEVCQPEAQVSQGDGAPNGHEVPVMGSVLALWAGLESFFCSSAGASWAAWACSCCPGACLLALALVAPQIFQKCVFNRTMLKSSMFVGKHCLFKHFSLK